MPKAKVAEQEIEDQEEGGVAHDETEELGAMFENTEEGLVVDLAKVEDQKFELLPKQKYLIMISEATYQLSKSSGKPMWNCQATIASPEQYKGRKLFPMLSFSEKALPGTKAVLAILNPALADTPFRVNDPEIVQSIVGKYAKVAVGIQPAQGEYEERNQIKRWFMPDGDEAFIAAAG